MVWHPSLLDSSLYSDSVVERAISDCMTKPVLDSTISGLPESIWSQPPAKSASTKHSIPFVMSGLRFEDDTAYRDLARQVDIWQSVSRLSCVSEHTDELSLTFPVEWNLLSN